MESVKFIVFFTTTIRTGPRNLVCLFFLTKQSDPNGWWVPLATMKYGLPESGWPFKANIGACHDESRVMFDETVGVRM